MNSAHFNSELKRVQIQYDEQITQMIENLQNHSSKRYFDYKECEELARNAARMNLRWRKMTSLTQETLMEFDNENRFDMMKIRNLKLNLEETSEHYCKAKSENEQLLNLLAIVEQVVGRLESKRSIH